MGFQIEDGLGKGTKVGVSSTGNRLNASSRIGFRSYYISRDNGQAFSVTSIDTAVAGEYSLYFQNTSTTRKFYVSEISLGSAELAIFKISQVSGTAAGGSVLTPINMNLSSSNSADANVRGNGAITGLTEEGVIYMNSIGADSGENLDVHEVLILGTNDAIAIEYDTGAGALMHATIIGFFDEE